MEGERKPRTTSAPSSAKRGQMWGTIIAVILLAVYAGLMTGCGSPGAPHPPSLELPRAVDDLSAARKGDQVTLTWTPPVRTTDGQIIRERNLGFTWICRLQTSTTTAPRNCEVQVGQAPPAPPLPKQKGQKRPSAPGKQVFTVTLPAELQQANATGFANFAVEVRNRYVRSAGLSDLVKVPLAPTLPPPAAINAKVLPDAIEISWKSGTVSRIPAFVRLYRREEGKTEWVALPCGEPCGDRWDCISVGDACADRNFEWEKTYLYKVTYVTRVIQDGNVVAEVEGDDSPEVKIFAHDVFPPAVPQGLEAVASGVGQKAFIDLTWTPDTDADLAGYFVYRQQGANNWTKLNQQPLPAPAFRDNNVAAGATYTYTVSAVDVRNNESARSQPASETVPAEQR